jgi:uncharacterized protein YeaO (DUF488 family)
MTTITWVPKGGKKNNSLMPFYHEDHERDTRPLTKDEQVSLQEDWEDIQNQRKYRDRQLQKWRWSGSVYNVLQTAHPDDRISQITIGWIRSYIDTGISQMTAGEPEFDFSALGPSDEPKTLLWKKLVETVMCRSNYGSHQKIAITDSHVFGPGVFEVYQQRPYRTIRVPKGDGFEDKVILDHRVPRVGVRAISPFRCTRNPNVSDPNEVGSCTKEEILSWNQFVQKYGRCLDKNGEGKYKNIEKLAKGSHVKITIYQDEIRDVYRIYALSYGNESDGEAQNPPEQLGIPIFDRPLKIHDIYSKKGELERSVGLNIPGMCNLVFLPYADKLNIDYETHDLYGMGLPEHMEGLDTFMQTAFNMTVDNWRLANTVVLNYKSDDGSVPDFDANTYYGGEFVNADVTSTNLGQDRTVNFDNMYEVLQKLTIPATGININQIAGDTSRTAFEFSQRIEANNKRSEMRLKEWEQGPLKRLGTLLLSAALSELTVHDLEAVREQDYSKILSDIDKGRATKDDFEFADGKPVKRKVRFYIDVKGKRERFTKKRGSRKFSVDSTENTLVDDKNPEVVNKIPVTDQYVMPDWYVESGILFDTKVDSKRMITNKKIRDTQAMQSVINNFLTLLQVDPQLGQMVDVSKLFEKIMKFADMDAEDIMKNLTGSQEEKLLQKIADSKNAALTPPQHAEEMQEMAGVSNPQQSQALSVRGVGAQDALQRAAEGAL